MKLLVNKIFSCKVKESKRRVRRFVLTSQVFMRRSILTSLVFMRQSTLTSQDSIHVMVVCCPDLGKFFASRHKL